MALPLVFHASARKDIIDASAWYEGKKAGLSEAYLAAVGNCASQIARHPLNYPELSQSVRRAPTKRFPYWIYYLIESDRIVVLAVLHARRDPGVWVSRIT
jgi:toxin ParE1/3/4